jgi:hypothetical protein
MSKKYIGLRIEDGKPVTGNKLQLENGGYWICDIKPYGYTMTKVHPESVKEIEGNNYESVSN